MPIARATVWSSVGILSLGGLLAVSGCGARTTGDGLPDEIGCSACHGSEANAAPPTSLDGSQDTSDPGVGAHQAHLVDGDLRAALECSECHRVPTSVEDEGHVDTRPAEVIFGSLATTGGLQPTWDRAADTCASTYCHGASLTGGAHPVVGWTQVDGSQVGCDGCHGSPPPPPHPPGANCSVCHSGTVAADGTIDVAGGLHIDGKVDAPSLACDSCHGQQGESAPPLDVSGNSDTSAPGVGAHAQHLATSSWHAPVACQECHIVPADVADPGHADDDLPAELTWGALAASDNASPTYAGAGGACNGSYCHGATLEPGGSNTAPTWTAVGTGEAACGTCHGLPPAGNHPAANNCENCHGQVIGPNQVWVDASRHIDGRLDLSDYHPDGYADGTVHGPDFNADPAVCANCHGANLDGGAVDVSCETCHSGFQANCVFCHGETDNLSGAPPEDVAGGVDTGLRGVGAHTAHVTAGSDWHADLECGACHVVPADALSPGHIDPRPAELTWSGLAVSDNASPAFEAGSGTCSNTYCHGATLDPGGSNTQPTWTAVGSGEAACGTCHGLPPSAPHPAQADCENCHGDVIGAGFVWVDHTRHIDGRLDLSDYHPADYVDPANHGSDFNADPSTCQNCHGAGLDGGAVDVSCETCHSGFQSNCLFCHGGTDNQTGAPPEDVFDGVDTGLRGVGAHTAHVTQNSGWHADIPCATCHVVPADALAPGHIDPAPAELTWTAVAVADGASPGFDGASTTCSGVYCHGETLEPGGSNTTPDWTQVDGSQAQCGTCHSLPPGGNHPAQGACHNCHGEVIGQGLAWIAPERHIDGIVDATGACGGCHGDPPDPGNESYPGGGGAHPLHATALGLACATCHGHNGTGPQHNEGNGVVAQANVDVVFDLGMAFPGGTSMANGGVPTESYNAGDPTCFVGCHNPVPGDVADLANAAVWTDASISCAECHERPQTELDINHDLDPNADDDATVRAACQECHDHGNHTGGALAIVDPDGSDAFSYQASGLSGLCRTCHDGGAGTWFSDRTPADQSVYWTAPTAHDEMGLDCDTCHDHHGTAGNTRLVEREETGCAPCHNGIVAEMNDANTPTHHHVVDAEQGAGTPLECTTCHDPHVVQRNPWRPMTDPLDGTLVAAGDVLHDYNDDINAARNDNGQYCLRCHRANAWSGAIDVRSELLEDGTINTGFYRNNSNLHRAHMEKLGGNLNDVACTYCHNAHSNTGPSGINRGALLYPWLTVNNYPYVGKNSCSTGDGLDDCH